MQVNLKANAKAVVDIGLERGTVYDRATGKPLTADSPIAATVKDGRLTLQAGGVPKDMDLIVRGSTGKTWPLSIASRDVEVKVQ